MRFTECRRRPVVDTATATTVGKVDALLVDAALRRVVAAVVKRKGPDLLRWESLIAFGPDAVTISGVDVLQDGDAASDALRSSRSTLIGKRVLTEDGDAAGTLVDVEFDPMSGAVTALVTADGELAGARLLGVGDHAVVVRRTAQAPWRA